MKTILTLTICLFAAWCARAQKSFEGKVTYSLQFISNTPGVSGDVIGQRVGTTQLYYTKGANYKYEVNGTIDQWSVYVAKEKRVYGKSTLTDTLKWYSVTTNHDTIYHTELKENDTTILGYPCARLTFTCKSGIQVYYFNRKFFVNADLYRDYREVDYFDYLAISGAVALKEVFISPGFTEVVTATKIEQIPIDDKIFELPPNAPVAEERPFD